MTNHKKHISDFSELINKDVDPRSLKNTMYIDAMNIDNGFGYPTPSNIRGNETPDVKDFTLSNGVNSVIGAVEDKVTNSVIYFMQNSLGFHKIIKWFSEGDSLYNYKGEERQIIGGPVLEFIGSQKVHSAEVIDGRYLIWTDGYSVDGETVIGGVPKKINIEKGIKKGKFLQTEINFTEFPVGSEYFVNVINEDGTSTGSFSFWVSTGNSLTAFLAALDTLKGTIDFTYTVCNNKIIVTAGEIGKELVFTSTSSVFFSIPFNYYPTLSPEHLTLKKPQPKNAITPFYATDANVKTNYVKGQAFQFTYRYIFDDNERSAWAPYSYVSTNYQQASYLNMGVYAPYNTVNSETANKIVLSFDDDLIENNIWRCFIKKIEIAVRFENTGVFYSLGVHDVSELAKVISGVVNYQYEFFNDKTYGVIASDDVSSINTQALKPYSYVPRKVTSLRCVSDKDGVTRLLLGGCIENYNVPNCVLADVSVIAENSDFTLPALIFTTKKKSFKAGGVYKLGVVYEDDLGRQSAVIPIGTYLIPFKDNSVTSYGNKVKGFEIDFQQNAPSWADRFRIVSSKNLNQLIYFQERIYEIKYWNINELTGEGVIDNNDPTHIGFEFALKDELMDSFSNVLFNIKDDAYGRFQVANDDRLQIVSYSSIDAPSLAFSTEFKNSDINDLNYQVAGYCLGYPDGTTTESKYVVFIRCTDDMEYPFWNMTSDTFDPNPFMVCEIYRKNAVDEKVYFELPDTYGITNLQHESPIQIIERGDAYNIPSQEGFIISSIERASMNLNDFVVLNDFGRPVAEDDDYREVFDYSKIRMSDAYLSLSDTNNLNAFRGLEYIRLSRDFGHIVKLAKIKNNVLAVCSKKVQPIYVGSGYVQELSGNTQISRSDRVLNVADSVVYDWGSLHPMSITEGGNSVYGYDRHNRLLWQFSQNGLKPISDRGLSGLFREISRSRELFSFGSDYIVTGYDQANKRVYVTFRSARFDNLTYGYDTVLDRWIGQYGFIPEYYSKSGSRFVSFRDGELWVHDTDNYCNFYGQQQNWYIEFSVNPEPENIKLLQRIRVQCNNLINVTVTVPSDLSYPEGKESRILAKNLNILEGQLNGDYLRDINDTNPLLGSEQQRLLQGRPIRGDHFIVRIYSEDSTILTNLYRVLHFYSDSENIN